jgi:hypothetical protein
MEPTPAADAPDLIVELLLGNLQMDSCLRLYGHPGLLRVAEAVNGPDFVPFNEVVFIKDPRVLPLEGEREQPRAVAPHRRALPRSPDCTSDRGCSAAGSKARTGTSSPRTAECSADIAFRARPTATSRAWTTRRPDARRPPTGLVHGRGEAADLRLRLRDPGRGADPRRHPVDPRLALSEGDPHTVLTPTRDSDATLRDAGSGPPGSPS